jgi:hypothetical protein
VPLAKADAVDHWLLAAEDAQTSTDAYKALRQAVSEFVSDDAILGIGYQGEEPLILAIDGDHLLRLAPNGPKSEAGDTPILTSSISLKAPCRVDVESEIESGRRASHLVRTWTLADSVGDAVMIRTRKPYYTPGTADHGGDDVMSEVLRRLGWPVPMA